jgi:hypothetical protein
MADSSDEAKSSKKTAVQRKRQSKLTLKIALDTNQLYTGSASDLLKSPLHDLILECRRHSDVNLEWWLPEVVRHEREYQMLKAAHQLIPAMAKLERLLGHNLGIGESILATRVHEAVEQQIKDLDLKVIHLDVKAVDWPRLIHDAAYRELPFGPGESEKGFRDAVILESFVQLVADSPKTPSVCRIALVTNDELLSKAIVDRTEGQSNVRILKSLDDLESLINTLVSDVTDDFVLEIRGAAATFFYSEDNKEGLVFKEKVLETISERFSAELLATPPGASHRENGYSYISAPRFVAKTGQQVTWITSIYVQAQAYRWESSQGTGIIVPGSTSLPPSGIAPFSSPVDAPSSSRGTQVTFGSTQAPASSESAFWSTDYSSTVVNVPSAYRKVLVNEGKSTFEVTWSVSVTAAGKLTRGRVKRLEHRETSWE